MTSLITLFLLLNIPPVSESAPNRQPQLAASQSVVALVFGSGNSVMFAQSKDDGATFSKPVAIAAVPILALGRHRGPRIVFSGKTMLVSAIGSPVLAAPGEHTHGGLAEGDLLLWRSIDGGKTWSKAISINDAPGAAREGLHAISADDKGNVAAVWLDLRVKGTRLYGAFSHDAGETWSKNVLVYESSDGTICQCCHPTLASLGNGEFAVMFRNFVGGNRDMYLLHIREGAVVSKAEKLGVENWALNACPMDGGGMAAENGHLLTAWRRGADLFIAEPGKQESRIGSGTDVALAVQGGRTYALWTKAGAIEASVTGKIEVLSDAGAFPVAVPLASGGVLAAWESNGIIQMRRLR